MLLLILNLAVKSQMIVGFLHFLCIISKYRGLLIYSFSHSLASFSLRTRNLCCKTSKAMSIRNNSRALCLRVKVKARKIDQPLDKGLTQKKRGASRRECVRNPGRTFAYKKGIS